MLPAHPVLCSAESKRLFSVPACFPLIAARKRQAIATAGASVLYLPSYSPDLNPIKQAFAKLKALLRAKAMRTVEALWNAIGDIVTCFTAAECRNYMQGAGYFQSG